jgi:hypothetical protein
MIVVWPKPKRIMITGARAVRGALRKRKRLTQRPSSSSAT